MTATLRKRKTAAKRAHAIQSTLNCQVQAFCTVIVAALVACSPETPATNGTERIQLESVQQSRSDPSCATSNSCLPDTSPIGQDRAAGYADTQYFPEDMSGFNTGTVNSPAVMGDYDGDGDSDIFLSTGGDPAYWGVLLASPADPNIYDLNRFLVSTNPYGADATNLPYPMDANGDGRTDILVRNSSGEWRILVSTGAKSGSTVFKDTAILDSPRRGIPEPLMAQDMDKPAVIDLDNDGRDDFVYVRGTRVKYRRAAARWNQEFDTTINDAAVGTEVVYDSGSLRTADFDGDGREDLALKLKVSGSGYTWNLYRSVCCHGYEKIAPSIPAADAMVVLDINGDGLTDLAYRKNSDNTWYTRLSIGSVLTGFTAEASTGIAGSGAHQLLARAVDRDGDGRDDLLRPHDAATSTWRIHTSTGRSYSNVSGHYHDMINNFDEIFGVFPAELNADGNEDIVYSRLDQVGRGLRVKWLMRIHSGSPPDS